MALKARALLYQASDLFNGNPDYSNFVNKNGEHLFSTVKDKEKWRRAAEAADSAIQVCLMNGKHLVQGERAATDLQSIMLDIEYSTRTFNFTSDEALWMIKKNPNLLGAEAFEYTLPNTENDPNHLLEGTSVSPSMKMVEMFLYKLQQER